MVLISNDLDSLSLLVKGTEQYCRKFRVNLVPSKTKLLVFNTPPQKLLVEFAQKMTDICINGQAIDFADKAEHVGIIRCPDGNMPHILGRITAHRKAMQAINAAGVARHHMGNPTASLRIHQMYGTSVLFSGIACLYLSPSEVKIIDSHYQRTIQSIQKLHQGTPRAFTFLMAGCLPGEAIVHMKQLTLFLMICHLPEDILHLHGKYVLATGQPPKKSWFSQILVLCEKYQLPHPHLLLEHPLSKDPFKKHVKQAVTKFWEDVLQQEALELLSLKMFHALSRSLSQPDYIWVTAGNNSFEVRKSCILARMMSGRYRTDYFARLWTSNKKGLCLIPGCADKIGDLQHLLIECSALSDTRTTIIEILIKKAIMLLPLHSLLKMIFHSQSELQCCFILDPFSFHEVRFLCNLYGQTITKFICYFVRTFAYTIHIERKKFLEL